MQKFICDGSWDDETIFKAHQESVPETLVDPQTAVLVIDGCDFPKAGKISVGVARQYCNTRVWTVRPRTEAPPAKGKGRARTGERLCEGELAAVPLDRLVGHLPPGERWLSYEIKEEGQGADG